MTEPNGTKSAQDHPVGTYDRKNPFPARLIDHRSLTLEGSGKDTRHFSISLTGSGLSYRPGDSLGVIAKNGVSLTEEIIERLGFAPDTPVHDRHGHPGNLRDVLIQEHILNRANLKLIPALARVRPESTIPDQLQSLLDNRDALKEYIHTRDYIDVFNDFPPPQTESPDWFIESLSPIPPRLYSIASSLDAHPGEVQLCVGIVRYHTHGRDKTGLCTGFLADHTTLHETEIPVYVQTNNKFRLPEDSTRDIIMVGPGTGIAPFRAFLEQRQLEGATGRNWLFFGEQHKASDFLYGDELSSWRQEGHLHSLDLAFSRDQDHKIYVQHRMLEKGREIWDWLQNGAYFYVCGDAKRMAKDVHQTLIDIATREGGLTPDDALEYVRQTLMKTEKRYLRDVY